MKCTLHTFPRIFVADDERGVPATFHFLIASQPFLYALQTNKIESQIH